MIAVEFVKLVYFVDFVYFVDLYFVESAEFSLNYLVLNFIE